MSRILAVLLIMSIVFSAVSAWGEADLSDGSPILMERRDVGGYNDLVSGLKTKTLGGRMRLIRKALLLAGLAAPEASSGGPGLLSPEDKADGCETSSPSLVPNKADPTSVIRSD